VTARPVLLAVALLAAPAAAQPPPDRSADAALNAARKLYNDGHVPAARDAFRQFLRKYPGDRRAADARYGLGLCLLHADTPDYAAAVEPLTQATGDGGHPDRGLILYHLAVAHRGVGLKEGDNGKATGSFNDAARRFHEARHWFTGKRDDARVGRCRCDQADAEIRAGRAREARGTVEPFVKDEAYLSNTHRPLGLYYHGLACFLEHDLKAAGRSLNQLAPFADPAFGGHARYLVGRVLHLQGEPAEASVHYAAVVAEYERSKRDAAKRLKEPDRLRGDPAEKARLAGVATGPPPDHVAGATFHLAAIGYEEGKFADALARFREFGQAFPDSPLGPDARLRVGCCLVRLKRYDEAAKALAPVADGPPRLADQSLLWLGKARVGLALAADPNAPADRTAKLGAAIDNFRRAADAASRSTEPDARGRRGDALMDLGDALHLAGQFQPAAQEYERVWNERLLPDRRHEEVLHRLAAGWAAAGDLPRSDHWCHEYANRFPQGTLRPAVLVRTAENSLVRGRQIPTEPHRAAERRQRFEEAARKYQEAIERYPGFERASHARYALGVCRAELGDLDGAVQALDAIPPADRTGELAAATFLLADCLLRLASAKADDAAAHRERLTAAAGLLESYAAANPKAADVSDARLKLGLCLARLGASAADEQERHRLLGKARGVFEAAARESPPARLEAARVRAMTGDVGGAIGDLRPILADGTLQKSPVAPLAALSLASLHREVHQPAEAAKVLDDARRRYEAALLADRDRAEWAHLLKYQHGVALLEAGKPADAQRLLDEVVQQARGKSVGAEAGLCSAKAAAVVAEQMAAAATEAKGKPNRRPDQDAAADQLIRHARERLTQAAERLEQWAAENAHAMPTADVRARLLYDAAWAYRSLPADKPTAAARSEERAANAYRTLIAEFPESALAADARFELAELRAERGDHEAAVKLLREAIDRHPPADLLDRIRLRLGASLAARGEHRAAAAEFDAVAADEKGPHHGLALAQAGEAWFAAGECAKAAARLAPFRDDGRLHHLPGVSERAVLRLGECHLALQNPDAARQAFEAVLNRSGTTPAAAEARYGLGRVLLLQGKYDDAVARFDEVTRATAAAVAARAQTQIGLCRLAQRRYADAAAALLLVPYTYDDPEAGHAAAVEAARAYRLAGRPGEAAKVLARLLRDAPPGSGWAKAAKEMLDANP
jgi:TolA-binding protein